MAPYTAPMDRLIGLAILFGAALLLLAVVLTAVLIRSLLAPPPRRLAWAMVRGLPSTPAEAGLDGTEWWVDLPGGARLPVFDVRGDPAAPLRCAVLLHGWAASRLDVLAGLEPWRARARRLILPDLRGHGEARGGRTTLSVQEPDDVRRLLEVLGEPAILVGWSMGAVVALRAASGPGSPDVRGVIALAPFDRLEQAVTRRLRREGWPAQPFAWLAAGALRLVRRWPAATRRATGPVACPALVLAGAHDPIVTVDEVRSIGTALGPRARVCTVTGADHFDPREPEPADAAREIDAWIERLGGEPPVADRPPARSPTATGTA